MRMTALNGIRCSLTRLQIRQPGMAPSREKAKHIREALVRQLMPQKSCPTTEMMRMSFTAPLDRRRDQDGDGRAGAIAVVGVVDEAGVGGRERDGQQQHPADEGRVEDRPPDALRRRLVRPVGLLGYVGRGVEAGDRVLREQEAQRQHVEPEHARPLKPELLIRWPKTNEKLCVVRGHDDQHDDDHRDADHVPAHRDGVEPCDELRGEDVHHRVEREDDHEQQERLGEDVQPRRRS